MNSVPNSVIRLRGISSFNAAGCQNPLRSIRLFNNTVVADDDVILTLAVNRVLTRCKWVIRECIVCQNQILTSR